jgi:hypothetical protein
MSGDGNGPTMDPICKQLNKCSVSAHAPLEITILIDKTFIDSVKRQPLTEHFTIQLISPSVRFTPRPTAGNPFAPIDDIILAFAVKMLDESVNSLCMQVTESNYQAHVSLKDLTKSSPAFELAELNDNCAILGCDSHPIWTVCNPSGSHPSGRRFKEKFALFRTDFEEHQELARSWLTKPGGERIPDGRLSLIFCSYGLQKYRDFLGQDVPKEEKDRVDLHQSTSWEDCRSSFKSLDEGFAASNFGAMDLKQHRPRPTTAQILILKQDCYEPPAKNSRRYGQDFCLTANGVTTAVNFRFPKQFYSLMEQHCRHQAHPPENSTDNAPDSGRVKSVG